MHSYTRALGFTLKKIGGFLKKVGFFLIPGNNRVITDEPPFPLWYDF